MSSNDVLLFFEDLECFIIATAGNAYRCSPLVMDLSHSERDINSYIEIENV